MQRARRRRQRVVEPSEPKRRQARRLDLERARVRRIRLGGGLPREHADERLELPAAMVRAREARQRGARRRHQRQRGLVGADRLVVGGRPFLVDGRGAVAPGEPRLRGQLRDLGAELERRLGRDQRVARLLGGAQQRSQRGGPARPERRPLAVERERLPRIAERILVERPEPLEPQPRLARAASAPRLDRRPRAAPVSTSTTFTSSSQRPSAGYSRSSRWAAGR